MRALHQSEHGVNRAPVHFTRRSMAMRVSLDLSQNRRQTPRLHSRPRTTLSRRARLCATTVLTALILATCTTTSTTDVTTSPIATPTLWPICYGKDSSCHGENPGPRLLAGRLD